MARAGLIDIGSFMAAQLSRRPAARERVRWRRRVRRMRELAAACGAEVVPGWSPAYDPEADVVMMPSMAAYAMRRLFVLQTTYFLDLGHELIHWTGHSKRLARIRHRIRLDESYAREECIAEMGAVLLCFDMGLTRYVGLPNAKYLQSWLSGLPTSSAEVELETAFVAANQAAAFLLARSRSHRGGSWTG